MASYRFLLSEDRISPGGWAQILTGGANRVMFCLQGSVGLGDGRSIAVHDGALAMGNTHLQTGHDGAILWRWELVHGDEEITEEIAGVTSRVLCEAELELDEGEDYVMRLESIGLPPEDSLPEHKLMGPAIAALMQGELLVRHGMQSSKIGPVEAWFDNAESATSLEVKDEEPTAFIRCLLLPAVQHGEPAMRYLASLPDDAEEAKRFHKTYVDDVVIV